MSKPPVLIISHANCTDGATAAAITEMALSGRVIEHHPEGYNYTSLPDVRGKEVYIVDFCYRPEEMAVIDSQCSRLVLLDHHASAEKSMKGFVCRCGEIHFDMQESGASLTWKYFFKEKEVPQLVKHVKDFDLWQWKLEHTKSTMAYLEVVGHDDIKLLKSLIERGDEAMPEVYLKGSHFSQLKDKLVQELAGEAMEIDFLGHKILKAATPASLSSFVGNELAKRTGTFGVVYRQCPDGSLKLGLRSVPGYSLLDIAAKLGGGGHPSACGAILKDPAQIRAFYEGFLQV